MPSILHDRDKVLEATRTSSTIQEALMKLGLRAAGGNYKALKKSCLEFGISLPKRDYNELAVHRAKMFRTDEDVFAEESTYNDRTKIKKRMFAMGIPNICNKCGQLPIWNGLPLTLTLEHINGIWNDNRLENLEILCGHCHSQTATFAGRATRKKFE